MLYAEHYSSLVYASGGSCESVVVPNKESTERNTFGLMGFNDLPARIEFCGKLVAIKAFDAGFYTSLSKRL